MDINDFSACHVVVCDDSITNVMILAKVIEEQGLKHVHTFTDPRKVVPFIKERKGDIDLLILDIEMPHMTGHDVMNALRTELPGGPRFPILVITGLDDKQVRYQALMDGANDFVTKPIDQLEVVLRVRSLLRVQRALRAQTDLARELEIEVEKRTVELDHANNLLVRLLALAGELRDGETGQHVARVGRFSRILAAAVGLPAELCFMIEKAAPMHDVGKIGIPDSILLKPGKLDEAERKVMDSHTVMGLKLLGEFGHDSMLIQMASSIAYNHHERWDGKGYPRGMRGESIPIEGRIVAIADVFDALTTQRPYKEAWPNDKAFAFLEEQAGAQFDPALVKLFIARRDEVARVQEELRDDKPIAATVGVVPGATASRPWPGMPA